MEKRDKILRLGVWALFFFVFCGVFLYSLEVRKPAYGYYPLPGDNLWRILIQDSIWLTKNWQYQGILANGFGMNFRPATVQFASSVSSYASYPPGFVLFPALLAKALGANANVDFFMNLSLATHLLVCVLLFLVIAKFLAQLRFSRSEQIAYGTVAACFAALFPPAMIYFQNAWWADVMVLPLFLAMILLEQHEGEHGQTRWFRRLRWALGFAGAFTDWLFFLLLGFLWLRSISSRRAEKIWAPYLAPILAAVAFHVAVVLDHGMGTEFLRKLGERAGLGKDEAASTGLRYLFSDFPREFGGFYRPLYLVCFALQPVLAALFLARERLPERARKPVETLGLISLPLFLHAVLLRQHYVQHHYNQLKFIFVLAAASILIWPLLFSPLRRRWGRLAALAPLSGAALVLAGSFPGFSEIYNEFYGRPHNADSSLARSCRDIDRHTSYEDVLFSPDTESDWNPGGIKITDDVKVICYKPVLGVLKPVQVNLYLERFAANLEGKAHKSKVVFFHAREVPEEWRTLVRPETLVTTPNVLIAEFDESVYTIPTPAQ